MECGSAARVCVVVAEKGEETVPAGGPGGARGGDVHLALMSCWVAPNGRWNISCGVGCAWVGKGRWWWRLWAKEVALRVWTRTRRCMVVTTSSPWPRRSIAAAPVEIAAPTVAEQDAREPENVVSILLFLFSFFQH